MNAPHVITSREFGHNVSSAKHWPRKVRSSPTTANLPSCSSTSATIEALSRGDGDSTVSLLELDGQHARYVGSRRLPRSLRRPIQLRPEVGCTCSTPMCWPNCVQESSANQKRVRRWAGTVPQKSVFFLSAITILEQERASCAWSAVPAPGQTRCVGGRGVQQGIRWADLAFGEREALLCAPMRKSPIQELDAIR